MTLIINGETKEFEEWSNFIQIDDDNLELLQFVGGG